jgi:hypothetical protein
MDDGKPDKLSFRRCETGFVFEEDPSPGYRGRELRTWAFSSIGEASCWLFEHFKPALADAQESQS